MGGVVVDDEVHIKLPWNVLIHILQERQVFLMTVPALALGQHLAVGNIEGGKEGGRPMPFVVVSDSLNISQAHRQQWLSPVQGLDLTLFVDTQYDRILRRAQIEADNVTDFFHKERVGRQLEVPLAMGLQAKRLPDAVDTRRGDPGFPGN